MLGFLKRVFAEFSHDKAGQMSAAFAYIAIFSIGPLLLVLISIAGLVFGQKAAEGQLFGQLSSVMGPAAAKNLQSLIAHTHNSGKGLLALAIGSIGSLLGAIGLSTQLQNSFDTVFGAIPDPKAGIKRTIYTKLKNVSLLILGSLLVMTSILVSTVVSGLGHKVKDHIGLPPLGLEFINSVASLVVFVSVLYLIYRVIPDVKIPKHIAFWASLWVSVLFLIGKVILAIIISKDGTASAYGAAAAVIVLLLWFYYTAQILILGAEGIKVHAQSRKLSFSPKRYTLARQSINIDIKNDLRGKLLQAFARGYSSKSQK